MTREAPKDWISNLPDSLLHHIHSFLEVKDGARTSVLSKRWKYIWTTVPTLEFRSFTTTNEKFMDFVDGTLHRRNSSNVDKFSLRSIRQLNESRVHSWISALIRGNVKQLSLDLQENNSLSIPLSLFTYQSLTSLDLTLWDRNFTFPKFVYFPKLKHLTLQRFKFSDEHWNEEIFSNSPVLEELVLKFCQFRMRNFCISVPTLKLLEFQSWDNAKVGGLRDCALKIHAPSLVTFIYNGVAAKEYVLSSFLSTVKAVVRFGSDIDGAQISPLLRALAHVKCLTVSDQTLQALCSVYKLSNNLLVFHNVNVLKVANGLTIDQGLVALLRALPNLESLIFEMFFWDEEEDSGEEDNDESEGNGDDDNDAISVDGESSQNSDEVVDISEIAKGDSTDKGKSNYDDEDSWALHIPHLKSVCFQEFVGNPREVRWVKQVLKNAKALQIITFRHYACGLRRFINAKSQKQVMAEIPKFPRVSTGCVFKFYSQDKKSVIEIS